ncbi:hypothetical protein BCV70DRAFT_200461 [Testicularia cyperi]|uniref:Uncharacterized protein n=1 Tax=Testicularia cyperi TaxID=1882483 RepID=A0A317XQC8_9BASI|nr:hypothetical protein BCV70DRAFT_200461 [Testicularia cyperi]
MPFPHHPCLAFSIPLLSQNASQSQAQRKEGRRTAKVTNTGRKERVSEWLPEMGLVVGSIVNVITKTVVKVLCFIIQDREIFPERERERDEELEESSLLSLLSMSMPECCLLQAEKSYMYVPLQCSVRLNLVNCGMRVASCEGGIQEEPGIYLSLHGAQTHNKTPRSKPRRTKPKRKSKDSIRARPGNKEEPKNASVSVQHSLLLSANRESERLQSPNSDKEWE